jgi:hypothetical protein
VSSQRWTVMVIWLAPNASQSVLLVSERLNVCAVRSSRVMLGLVLLVVGVLVFAPWVTEHYGWLLACLLARLLDWVSATDSHTVCTDTAHPTASPIQQKASDVAATVVTVGQAVDAATACDS